MPEALRGELGLVSLASVLQLAESEYLCGDVVLRGGTIELHNGNIVAASFADCSGVSGAVEALLRASGTFRVQTRQARAAGASIANAMSVVLESCRLQDELERLGGQVLRARDGFTGSERIAGIVSRLDGERALARHMLDAGCAIAPCLDELVDAVERGDLIETGAEDAEAVAALLAGPDTADDTPAVNDAPQAEATEDEAPERAAPPAPPAGVSLDDLIFDARREARRRHYDRAEELLEQALQLAPGDRILAQNLNRIRSLRSAAA